MCDRFDNQTNHDSRFDALEALIRSEVGAVKAEVGELRAEMVNELGGVKAEVAGLKTDLGGLKTEVGGLMAATGGLKAELGDVTAEVRGLSVRLDAMHGQIKIVAEGYGALVDTITDVKNGMQRLEAGQDHLALRMIAVESRLGLTR